MRIAYIGDFINHGDILSTSGTPIVFLLARLPEVEEVDVYCPLENKKTEPIEIPDKIKVIATYKYGNFHSVAKLIRLDFRKYDKIIFNLLPGAYGNSTLTNLIGLFLPVILAKIRRIKGVEIVYHNSVYTTDFRKIGWSSTADGVKIVALKLIEWIMFRSVKSFVLLRIYQERIRESIPNSKVFFLNGRYLEAITTIIQNGKYESETYVTNGGTEVPVVLLHGSWSPQKNLGMALEALSDLRKNGVQFTLIISGSLNSSFPLYKTEFESLMTRHSEIINQYLGRVEEKELFNLFGTSDLIILPYNSPGGHSGVIETGSFFENKIIAIDFPEFEEQATGNSMITLVNPEELEGSIARALRSEFGRRTIAVRAKIDEVQKNITELL